MNTPKVSVIITTHNRPELLSRALQSVLAQTFKEFEILVIDDSQDSSIRNQNWMTVDQFQNNNIQYLSNKFKKWVSWARNTWFQYAKWEFIALLDDDDSWEPNKLKEQLEYMKNHQNDWYCWTNIRYIDVKWELIWLRQFPQFDEDIKKVLLYSEWVLNSSLLVRRKVIDAVWYQNENYLIAQDYEWMLRIWKHTSGWNIQEYLTNYTRDNNSLCHSNMIKWRLESLNAFVNLGKDRSDYLLWLLLKSIWILVPASLSGTWLGTKVLDVILKNKTE